MNDAPSPGDDGDDELPMLRDALPGAAPPAPPAPATRPDPPDDAEPVLLEAFDETGAVPLSIPALRDAPADPSPVPPPAPDWEAFEDRVADRVLARLLSHGDRLVSPWLQSALAEVLARHMHALGQDLQATLDEGLAELVTRTISDEVARMRQQAADDAVRTSFPRQNDA